MTIGQVLLPWRSGNAFSNSRFFRNLPFGPKNSVHSCQVALGIRPALSQHSRFSVPSYSPLVLTSKTRAVFGRSRIWSTVAKRLGFGATSNVMGRLLTMRLSTG
ncbi:hypothetical protein AUG19_00875 [archaeon 13_1_20CM_2_54_9]|nr:MAG: hypothetical protein AUG19_00875 [archaeon 13_1_20CM_2_54_9]